MAGEVLESLIFGEHDGRRLTDAELVQNCIFLLNAGMKRPQALSAIQSVCCSITRISTVVCWMSLI
jgi:hypothetical protein